MSLTPWDVRGRPPEITEILPELWVGEFPRPQDVPMLRDRHEITAVLSLQDDDDLAAKGLKLEELTEAYVAAGIEFVRVPIADGSFEAVRHRLPETLAALHRLDAAGHRTLVHCNAGFNRAPTVVIAFLHAHRDLPLADARSHVRARRSVLPFMTVLQEIYGARDL